MLHSAILGPFYKANREEDNKRLEEEETEGVLTFLRAESS